MIDQHASLSEKFLKKGFWLYFFSFIIAPIGYVIKIILSSELTVSEMGILYGIISLIGLVSAFNDFGMTESLNHFLPDFITKKRYDKVKSILAYAIIAQLTTGILIASFFFFGADFIANNYFKTAEAAGILKIFALYFLGINIFQINSTFFMAVQNTLYNKLIELFRMSFVLISVLGIFLLDLGNIITYSYSWIIGLYIGILFALIVFYKKYYSKYLSKENIIWEKALFTKVFKYAIVVLLGAQAGTILGQMDMQMIIYLLGTTDAGYYTNYLSIISIPFMIIGPIFSLLFPIFSEMHSKGEYGKIKLIKKIFTKNILALGIAFNILFFVFAEIIAFILFGEKFIESGIILRYSILFLTFNFLIVINGNILAGVGRIKERLKAVLVAIVVNFFMNIILITHIGVYGAALATGIGWVVIWGILEYYLGKQFYVQLEYKFLTKNIVIMGLLGVFSYIIIIPLFENIGRGISFLYMFIISIIYFSIFVIINKKEFKFFILEIKKLKRGK